MSATNGWKPEIMNDFWKESQGLRERKNPTKNQYELGRTKISKIWCQETQKRRSSVFAIMA